METTRARTFSSATERRLRETPKAVLLDLDGTLLDTLEDLGHAVNRVLRSNGYPTHSLSSYRSFIGDGAKLLITRALPPRERNERVIRAGLEAFLKEYGENWNVHTKPFDGVPEMLDALKERGLKLAVLSNKPDLFTKRCVAEFFPKCSFEMVLGEMEGMPRKPDPSGALKVAANLKIRPSAFLYLGDSGVDMRTAIAAGMLPVGVLWGFRSEEELTENGAARLIKKPLEILELLE